MWLSLYRPGWLSAWAETHCYLDDCSAQMRFYLSHLTGTYKFIIKLLWLIIMKNQRTKIHSAGKKSIEIIVKYKSL